MNKEKENGINIPDEILYDRELTAKAKILYGEIARLCGDKGSCCATNRALGDLLNCNERSIQRFIEELKKNNFIKVELCKSYIRHIYII